jgi:ATP-dependent phosphoenolpyruvate carboxykinase
VLYPAQSWGNEDEYWEKYHQLANRFADNFKKYADATPQAVLAAGPG